MSRINIDVGGTMFTLENSTVLDQYPAHTLTKLYKRQLWLMEGDDNFDGTLSPGPLTIHVDRPPCCFSAILAFYQTGELHLPDTICPNAFKLEMGFWRVPEHTLTKCCLYRYNEFIHNAETQVQFFEYAQATENAMAANKADSTRRWHSLRKKLWKIFDYKQKSTAGQMYLLAIFLLVLASIVVFALDTLSTFQRDPTLCEMLDFLRYTKNDNYTIAFEVFNKPDCEADEGKDTYIDGRYSYNASKFHDLKTDIEENDTMATNMTLLELPHLPIRVEALDIIERIVDILFTFDIVMRLCVCASIKRYFSSIINIMDVLALLSFYFHIVIVHVLTKEYIYNSEWIKVLNYFQIFRITRLLRVAKNVRASRVLAFSLRQNLEDMVLLGLLLMIVISVFSCLVYLIEDRDTIVSIPQGMYWCIITITTIGYGDIYPVSAFGQILSCILSICGVLMTALTLPMFVNNFLNLYSHSCLIERIKSEAKKKFDTNRERRRVSHIVLTDSDMASIEVVYHNILGTDSWKNKARGKQLAQIAENDTDNPDYNVSPNCNKEKKGKMQEKADTTDVDTAPCGELTPIGEENVCTDADKDLEHDDSIVREHVTLIEEPETHDVGTVDKQGECLCEENDESSVEKQGERIDEKRDEFIDEQQEPETHKISCLDKQEDDIFERKAESIVEEQEHSIDDWHDETNCIVEQHDVIIVEQDGVCVVDSKEVCDIEQQDGCMEDSSEESIIQFGEQETCNFGFPRQPTDNGPHHTDMLSEPHILAEAQKELVRVADTKERVSCTVNVRGEDTQEIGILTMDVLHTCTDSVNDNYSSLGTPV